MLWFQVCFETVNVVVSFMFSNKLISVVIINLEFIPAESNTNLFVSVACRNTVPMTTVAIKTYTMGFVDC